MLRLLSALLVRASVLAASCPCFGCAADPQSGNALVADASIAPGLSSGTHSCQSGTSQACHCPDGTRTGTQSCGADGNLAQCACPSTPAPTSGAPSPNSKVCAQIAGLGSCTAMPYVSKQLPTSLSFVVDRSRSMLCNLPPLQSSAECEQTPVPRDPSAATKWRIVQDALVKTFDMLPGGSALSALTFFSNDGECGVHSKPSVELAPLSDVQRNALSSAVQGARPNGKTPIVGATILAYAHLHQEAKAPGNRFVVLITDGAESCNPDKIGQLLDVEVKKARDANIRTFVIGAPGSEGARAFLSELAFRGGTAQSPSCKHDIAGAPDQGDCHLDMTKSEDFAAALGSALGVVSSAAVGCDFAVPGSGNTSDVNVQYTPSSGQTPICFPADESKPCNAGANGWQFAKKQDGSRDTSRVVVCGPACDSIKKDPAARVDILVGCAPILL